MSSKLLIPALILAAGAAQAEGLPGVSDGPGPNLVIEVADTGPGLPAKAREHLFSPSRAASGRAGLGWGW